MTDQEAKLRFLEMAEEEKIRVANEPVKSLFQTGASPHPMIAGRWLTEIRFIKDGRMFAHTFGDTPGESDTAARRIINALP